MPYKMLKMYSILVSNYNLQEYSYTVRAAIEYINFNLQSSLSLATISSAIEKNASFLSSQFKKETGSTITSYLKVLLICHLLNIELICINLKKMLTVKLASFLDLF